MDKIVAALILSGLPDALPDPPRLGGPNIRGALKLPNVCQSAGLCKGAHPSQMPEWCRC